MIGWRARLGFLLPPGNPAVEPEMVAMAPSGLTVHRDRNANFATEEIEASSS
jgi:maleate isomerase